MPQQSAASQQMASVCAPPAGARTSLGRNVDLLGRGVYLDAALFNHSCAPNCSVSAGAWSLEMVVDEAVSAGDELTISYIETQQPLAARQKALRSCARCPRPRTACAPALLARER